MRGDHPVDDTEHGRQLLSADNEQDLATVTPLSSGSGASTILTLPTCRELGHGRRWHAVPLPMMEKRVFATAMFDSAGQAANYGPGEISFESRVDATFDVAVP